MHRQPPTRVCFGPFQLDLRAGELRRNGRSVLLHQQPFQVLLMLVELDGEIVTREEIRKKLWPNDTVVEFDHSINAAIRKLRRELDDSADAPKYIETVARRGYRLMVPVTWIEARVPDNPKAVTDAALAVATRIPDNTKAEIGALTGRTVSHYRVLDIIGGGGMGLVYRAEDLKLGRAVALKFLPEEMGSDPRALERFEREARAVSALSHPNICPIFEFDDYEGQPFIVMELLRGLTLREHIAAGRFRLSDQAGLDIAIQITAGLDAAHEKGIIHRDIKPANIFITEKSVAKILDFGVAKMLETSEPTGSPSAQIESGDSLRTDAQNLTRTGSKLGTAGYMSPEQVRGEALDVRSDIFSFGLLLYEMATGKHAFTGETEAMLHDAIVNREPEPLRERAPELSPELSIIVEKCLEKKREHRFQSAKEVRAALSDWQHDLLLAEPRATDEPESERPHRRYWPAKIAFAAVLVVIVGGVFYQRAHLTPKLTEEDTIVVADFANLTSDRLFDNAFKDALEVALGQTPFLNPLSAEKVAQVLKAMSRPPGEHLTASIVREVCLRTQSAAYVVGSISDAGNQYRIELNAVDCKTGRTLASVSSQAGEQNKIVARLGDASLNLREMLGEPPASLQKFNKPLAEATSASLEALQAYAVGQGHYGKPEAISDLQRATELDPEFAYAYLDLGLSYNILRLSDRRDQSFVKAYRLRERRLSYRDRLAIEFHYYSEITGEYDKLLSAAELAMQEFPRWFRPRNMLGRTLTLLGDYERSAGVLREALRLAPESLAPNINLVNCYIALDRLQDARVALDQAKARDPETQHFHVASYVVAFLQNEREVMDGEVQWAKNKPEIADFMLKEQSETAAYYGRVHKADEFTGQAVETALQTGAFERASDWRAIEALRSAKIGETARARKLAQEAVSSNSSLPAKVMVAMAFAEAGDTTSAMQLEQQLREKYPLNTLLRDRDLPSIGAEIFLQQGRPDLAVAALEHAVPYELGWSRQFGLDAIYVRGTAYLQAGNAPQAAAQFRKMLDHPGLLANSINGPLARLQFARAQVIMGDKEAARKSYQDFLTLWKDADPDIPIYKQAKAEYANIR